MNASKFFLFGFFILFSSSLSGQDTLTVDCVKLKLLVGGINGSEPIFQVGENYRLSLAAGCDNVSSFEYEVPGKSPYSVQIDGIIRLRSAGSVMFYLITKDGVKKSIGQYNIKDKETEDPSKPDITSAPDNNDRVLSFDQPIYAALYLDSIWNRGDTTARGGIVYNHLYLNYKIDSGDYDKIKYLKKYNEAIKKSNSAQNSGRKNHFIPSGLSKSAGALSGFINPTFFADGLARFAIARVKEELSIAYLDNFREKLGSFEQLRIMLPGVTTTLVDDDLFNYSVLLPTLRQNAWQDMNDFPVNLTKLLVYRKDSVDPKIYPVLMSSCDLIQGLRVSQPASELLEMIAEEDYIKQSNSNYANIVKAAALFSRNLHTGSDFPSSTGWANKRELDDLLAKPDAMNFFMAIMMAREKAEMEKITLNKIGSDPISLYKLLNNDTDDVSVKYRIPFYHLSRIGAAAREMEVSGKTDSSSFEGNGRMIRAIGEMIFDFHKVFVGNGTDRAESARYETVISAAATMEQALKGKQYGLALTRLVLLINEMHTCTDTDTAEDRKPCYCKSLSKYGKFLAALIDAKDSDDVQNVLESAAMPVQSYRIKRKDDAICVGLNLYPGVAIGVEQFLEPIPDKPGYGLLLAPTVPLGMSLDWGTKHGSISLFVPVIDVGAVAAFRLQEDVAELPELTWSNLIAPGVFLNWGFKNSPLYAGLGVQRGPSLRKITDSGVEAASSFRIAINFGVDMPVFQKNMVRNKG